MKKIILIIILSWILALFSGCDPDDPDQHVKIIVLDDFDPDFTNPPFDDRVTILEYSGTLINQMSFSNFNIATYGGHREISASADGNYYAVCQSITNPGLTKYDMNGNYIFQARGKVHACCFFQSRIYALTYDYTIYGDGSFVVGGNGNIITRSSLSGYDVVVDDLHQWVWFVGENVIRLDLNLNPIVTVDPITYLATSVDTDSSGNAWVCEKLHIQVPDSVNRVLKIAPSGTILFDITVVDKPSCVRVDKSNQNIWVAHWAGVSNFDKNGNLLLAITGFEGCSLEIDPTDQSIWIGTRQDVRHYSNTGSLIDIYSAGFSTNRNKCVALAVQ